MDFQCYQLSSERDNRNMREIVDLTNKITNFLATIEEKNKQIEEYKGKYEKEVYEKAAKIAERTVRKAAADEAGLSVSQWSFHQQKIKKNTKIVEKAARAARAAAFMASS